MVILLTPGGGLSQEKQNEIAATVKAEVLAQLAQNAAVNLSAMEIE